jgi:hypothetical protein
MTPERIDAILESCGPAWLGGQRQKIRAAMIEATREEHVASVNRVTCTCDLCWSVMKKLEAERLA